MKYIVASTVGTDEIHLDGGRVLQNQMGGAGIYALAGILTFCPDVAVVSGVGPGYRDLHGPWYEQNGINTDGLMKREGPDHITRISYRTGGGRLDEPDIGLERMRTRDPLPKEIARFCTGATRGIYTFKHLDREYMDAMLELKQRQGCKLMWEIAEDACVPENLPAIKHYMNRIDVFSINEKEASALLGTHVIEETVLRLSGMTSRWIYLRRGERGAVLLADGIQHLCPPVPNLRVVDPTGCGNASSAAVLYGCGEGYSPLKAGVMGSVAAAGILAQFGVPPRYTPESRREAMKLTEKILAEMKPRGYKEGAVNVQS
jgi:sugar/nucleoside kinase (ribokinase family)